MKLFTIIDRKRLLEEELNRNKLFKKILKAILTEHEIEFSQTHNILDPRNVVEEIGYKTLITDEDAIFLKSIYRARYPSDLGLLPLGEPMKKDYIYPSRL